MAMHLYKMLIKLTMIGVVFATRIAHLAKPNCQSHCGNISIPYPFGTSDGCYLDAPFFIICNTTFNPPRPFLNNSIEVSYNYLNSLETKISRKIEVLKISLEGQLKISNPVAYDCHDSLGNSSSMKFMLILSNFFISDTENKFINIGCKSIAKMYNVDWITSYGGCFASCDRVINGSCSGMGCCQIMIPKGSQEIILRSKNELVDVDYNPCSYAFVVEEGAFTFSSLDLYNLRNVKRFPLVLDWIIQNQTCVEAIKDPTSYACKENSYCTNSKYGLGYLCSCLDGFQGNPYLTSGCQDINECETLRPCTSTCYNLPGGYNCSCPVGFEGDGMKNGTGCRPKFNPKFQSNEFFLLGMSTCVGLLLLFVGAWWLHKIIKKRKDNKLKQEFFKRNGGLLLQQQLSSGQANVDKVKMFNSMELEKATNHFNVDRMLGQGGQGSVYKGMLADGRIVAVKKSKAVDEGQIEQFINEVVILSQIIHRNVVKLLGCCLETEVPLLVYEFIPNGTFFQYRHDQNEEFPLTWVIRLRIAREVSGALSYLHYAASSPIYHRDIKSSNILLDDKYRAKVADFGTSKSIEIGQTHVTTSVQGTFGYLDPEYFQSNKYTEKSDVYSFGVVLLELLTGQEVISWTSTGEARSLVWHFIHSIENNYVFDILDPHVMNEDRNEVMVVAKLAKKCLNLNGKQRPTMKEITMKLEGIRKSQETFDDLQNYEAVKEPWNVASTSARYDFDNDRASSCDTKTLLFTI